ncbi:MAG: PQQ-dependent sugar dehydrogenase [Pseudomonadales bacterium]
MKRLSLTVLILSIFMFGATQVNADKPFTVEAISEFDQPWALDFLPDGRMLVTEKKGSLRLVTQDGEQRAVVGLPDVDYGGQGGMGDVAVHPDFANNSLVYISYAEAGKGNTRGAAVARGRFVETGRGGKLEDLTVIWRQYPKLLGRGHYGHRIRFEDDGHLWISSGDRQKFTPSQDMQSNVGKILRLNDDGSLPADNPFVDYLSDDALVDDEGVYGQIWSLGHRNPLGIAFDLDGKLWVIEMGPAGGDELNQVKRAFNYGYPEVSNGMHYDGRPIPDHSSAPEYAKPAISWTPVISPGDLMVYRGKLFKGWRGDALVAGLSSRAIIRIELQSDIAKEVERYDMGARIRSVDEASDGSIWVLEDEFRRNGGRLLKLTPR